MEWVKARSCSSLLNGALVFKRRGKRSVRFEVLFM